MAAQLDPKRREKLRRAIIRHIEKYGRSEWHRLKKRFPDVAERTIYRIAKGVHDDEVSAELDHSVAMVKREVERTEYPAPRSLTAPPEPPRGLELIDKFHAVWDGTERQMAHALDEKGRICNVDLHHDTETLRAKLINVGTRLAASIYTVERMERMRMTMLEAIREADPDTARKIVRKLQALHERHGLSEGG